MLNIFWEFKKIPPNHKMIEVNLQKAFDKAINFVLANSLVKNTGQQVSLILTSQERIQQINRDYRHKDQTTDVLSFAEKDSDQKIPHLKNKDSLGEIYLNYNWLAKDNFRDLEKLFYHGYFHLLGFDHEKDNGEMEEWEDKIINYSN